MPKKSEAWTENVEEVIDEVRQEFGVDWDDETVKSRLSEFIEDNCNPEKFGKFLEGKAKAESQTPNENIEVQTEDPDQE